MTVSHTDERPHTDEGAGPQPSDATRPLGGNWPPQRIPAILAALALTLILLAGFLFWQGDSARNTLAAADESVQAARDIATAMLTYDPATVEEQLGLARDLLTGEFQQSYTALINDDVIPAAREQQIAASTSIPAAASVSVDDDQAVVLLFINQSVTIGGQPPGVTASSVRVTLDKVDGRWLISEFEPV